MKKFIFLIPFCLFLLISVSANSQSVKNQKKPKNTGAYCKNNHTERVKDYNKKRFNSGSNLSTKQQYASTINSKKPPMPKPKNEYIGFRKEYSTLKD